MALQFSSSRLSNLLAALAIIGILGAFLVVVYASNREVGAYGPTAITATAEGEVYFTASDRIYRLNHEGKLLDSVDFALLGVDGPVFQLAIGSEDQLLIQSGQNNLLQCDTTRWLCSRFFNTPELSTFDLMAFAIAPEEQRIYLATLPKHRLYAVDLKQRKPYLLHVPGGLKYPNQIVWLGHDHLLVADTNHHRIIELEDLGQGDVRLVQQWEAKNEVGRQGRTWPIAVARDEAGAIWVINGTGLLRDGDLVYYNAEGLAERRVELDTSTELSGMTLLPAGVLLTDSANYRLLKVSQDDFSVSAFGDDALMKVLSEIASQQAHWQKIYYLGVALILFFVSLGAVAGYIDWQARRGLRESEPSVSAQADAGAGFTIPDSIQAKLQPDVHGIYWLSVTQATQRMFLLSGILGPIVLIAMQLAVFLPLEFEIYRELMWRLLPLFSLLAIAFVFMAFVVRNVRIGTDGERLYLVDFLRRKASAPIEACEFTEQRVFAARVAVPIKHPMFKLYDKELFAELIAPILGRMNKTNEFAIIWRYLRRGDPTTWLGTLASVALLIAALWYF
jgi:hypothetical protein